MSKKNCIMSACGRLLAIASTLLLTGCRSASDENTNAEKAIETLGGRVVRSPNAQGTPIISLDLHSTKVTDAGLKELAGLKSLQVLNLAGTQVTDAGLKELADLKNLQILDLNLTKVTDAGLKELAGLKSLQTLNLNYTQVTDAGLKELAGLKSLRSLGLAGTKVTDAGVVELRKALSKCRITWP